jgi:CubicO group peptidase (beta-lactamase class C family)
VGKSSADITFRKLLTHRAGFTEANHGGDYKTFKGQIASGVVANPTEGEYTNGAFSIVRVLGSTMTNAVPKNALVGFDGALRDSIWDIITTDAFASYVQKKVFTPSGVSGITTSGTKSSALAYTTKSDASGWDSGNLGTELGGAGFRVSVNDMLDVMSAFRRKGTIVSAAKAQAALDAGLGIDVIEPLPTGKMYSKNGWWGGGGQTAKHGTSSRQSRRSFPKTWSA